MSTSIIKNGQYHEPIEVNNNRKNNMNKFSIGDVVLLKSGGPTMTVLHVSQDVVCGWFTETQENKADRFPAAALIGLAEAKQVGT